MSTVPEFIDRIFAGEVVCPSEIRLHNAERIMVWVRTTELHHTPEECTSQKKKDCVHAPGPYTADFAATLTSEANYVCICGTHGVDDPEKAAAIGAEFIERWTS